MSDDTKLGPQPDPVIEPGDPAPGGTDAIEDKEEIPLPRDLDPSDNPAVDDTAPEAVTEPDDKSQAPEGEASDQESGTQEDVKAGQESEDGSVEPPA